MQAQVKRRIVLGITTGGLFAGGGLGFAHADTSGASAGGNGGANGGTSNSPGILSGNSIQVPVDIPINVCGVTANVLGLLNPAAGNQCSNSGGATAGTSSTGTHASGGATAKGGASDSPGILSGNNVQVPIHAPVNVCGDGVNVVGLKNAAVDNTCSNGGTATGATGTHASGGASAHGGASNSPGILSGNNVQVPIDVPVNACGDTVNVIGLLNPAFGNTCVNK